MPLPHGGALMAGACRMRARIETVGDRVKERMGAKATSTHHDWLEVASVVDVRPMPLPHGGALVAGGMPYASTATRRIGDPAATAAWN